MRSQEALQCLEVHDYKPAKHRARARGPLVHMPLRLTSIILGPGFLHVGWKGNCHVETAVAFSFRPGEGPAPSCFFLFWVERGVPPRYSIIEEIMVLKKPKEER